MWVFFLVPLAIGALTIRLAPGDFRKSVTYAIFTPWISILIVAAGSIVFGFEVLICTLMALPIFLVLSSLGGYLFREKDSNSSAHQNTMLGIILLAPYLVTPLEMTLPTNDSYRIVENEIRINAPAHIVWENIINIPYIEPGDQQYSVFHSLGIPKLQESSLTQYGVGGVRNTVFENGLVFTETIIYWEENRSIKFLISPNSQSAAPPPYNMIGNKYLASFWCKT